MSDIAAYHIDMLKIFFEQLTVPELVRLRHDAIRLEDNVCKGLIDEILKKRSVKSDNA